MNDMLDLKLEIGNKRNVYIPVEDCDDSSGSEWGEDDDFSDDRSISRYRQAVNDEGWSKNTQIHNIRVENRCRTSTWIRGRQWAYNLVSH